jgi:hypothetical protein
LKPEAYNRSVERVYLDLCCLKRPEQADARLLTCDDRLLALAGRHRDRLAVAVGNPRAFDLGDVG